MDEHKALSQGTAECPYCGKILFARGMCSHIRQMHPQRSYALFKNDSYITTLGTIALLIWKIFAIMCMLDSFGYLPKTFQEPLRKLAWKAVKESPITS